MARLSVTYPRQLNILLDLIAFYEISIGDTRPLVWSVIVWCHDSVIRYFKDHRMTEVEWAEVIRLIEQPPAPQAREHAVQFVERVGDLPQQVQEALTRLAETRGFRVCPS